MRVLNPQRLIAIMLTSLAPVVGPAKSAAAALTLHERGYFATRGLNVLVYHNRYDGNFSDAKIAGIELIHHEVRTATNGDVRLSPTPEQWDPVPVLQERKVHADGSAIEARLAYPQEHFSYTLRVAPENAGVRVQVVLEAPLPEALVGRAGFNLEFLPAAYFGKSYFADDRSGQFPLYPEGPTGRRSDGVVERRPLATGRTLVLAPEDPQRRVTVRTERGELALYDGRNQAQNGWFVVRTLLPADATGVVLDWTLTANTIADWVRPPMIAHSQVGYHPRQKKVAVLEQDPNASEPMHVRLLRVEPDGQLIERLAGPSTPWGSYLRYHYSAFDFTGVTEPGLYLLEAHGERTAAFRVADDVFATVWHPTLDVFFPVQMDHVVVNEAYRVWHGLSHLDDARQAPPNHEHFDLYAMGPTTDSPFDAGEHVPGLAVGGWFDAGDYDLRTQTIYGVVASLVHSWETFRPLRDETTVDQARRHVELHQPDGVPDILQQIEHGVLQLLAQHRVFGHAIHGIVEPDLGQYTHLGDASTKTDNRRYDPALRPDEIVGDRSGVPDDRWVFTTRTTALNFGSAAALAAASRALRGYQDGLADECLAVAQRVWERERAGPPAVFRHGNTTGGDVRDEEVRAASELLITTRDRQYARRLAELWPVIDERFVLNANQAVRALPYMDANFAQQLRGRAARYRDDAAREEKDNPFGVPITRGGWAGNGRVISFGTTGYWLHKAFPDLVGPEPTFQALAYLHGCHPGSNLSFVSAVGARSKTVAYGANRADFSFIAGAIVPGVLIIEPDFPENKEDWPFLWGQNEYVISLGATYLFLAHAAHELAEAANHRASAAGQ
jgi:endoglucanase